MSNYRERHRTGETLYRLFRSDEYALARLMLLVLALTLFFGLREAWGLDQFDVSKSTTSAENSGYSSNVTAGNNLFMGSGQTTVHSSWAGEAIVVSQGGSLIVGNNEDQNAAKLNLTLTSITFDNTGGATEPILRIVNSSDPANGTILNLGTLNISQGGTVDVTQGIANAQAGWNTLSVNTLNADGSGAAEINIEGNALFEVKNSAAYAVIGGANAVTVNLGSNGLTANASFAGGLTVNNGSIVASEGHGNVAVGTGKDALKVVQGGLEASSGFNLTVLEKTGGTALGNVSLGGGTVPVTVTVDGGSNMNMANLTVVGEAEIIGTAGANWLKVADLTVEGLLTDTTGVTTVASGVTTVDGGKYITAGTTNSYSGGIEVVDGGILTSADAGSTITVGNGIVNVSGGSIAGGENAGNSAFVVKATQINITGANTTALDARTGAIDLSAATVNVAATGAMGILPDYGITVGGYNQTAGAVTVGREDGNRSGNFIVSSQAIIGGGTQSTSYNITDNATQFRGGARVGPRGVIATSGAGAGEKSITFGYSSGATNRAGDLILAGNGSLRGQNGELKLLDAYAEGAGSRAALSKVQVQGSGNTVLGDVNTTKMDVVVSGANAQVGSALRVQLANGATGFSVNSLTVNGGEVTLGGTTSEGVINSFGNVRVNANGALASEGFDSTIRNTGAVGNRLTVARGGSLTTRTADLVATGFAAVDIGGQYVAGWDGAEIAKFSANSAITITSTGTVGLTGEAARNAKEGDTIMEIVAGSPASAVITSQGTLGDLSMFGSFGFRISDDRRSLLVGDVSGQIAGDYTDADIDLAVDNLRKIWGKNQIGRDLGEIIYNASVINPDTGEYGIVADPSNSIPGNKNIDIFQALASPSGKVVGRDTLEYVNGAQNYGVMDVAISTSAMFMQDINRRAKAAGCQLVAVGDTASGDALANRILEQARYSRMWIGGFGTKNKATGSDGFSGYKYDSTGFIMGYDMAVMSNVVVGGAFAYAKGDYEDSGAAAHDSTIESYSGAVYGTLSLPMGLYATLSGGYTYSENDIRELRRDPSVSDYSWAESEFGGHTYTAGANVGWDIRFSQCFTLTPSVGINYIETRGSTNTWFLGGVGTQRDSGLKMKALFMPVDLSARYDMYFGVKCGLRFEGNVGYTRNFKNDGVEGRVRYNGVVWNGTGAPVSSAMRSQDQDQDIYRFGLGARYLYDKFDIGVKYDYMTSSNKTSHWLAATAGVKF